MKRPSGIAAASTGAPSDGLAVPLDAERGGVDLVGDRLDQLERLGVVHGHRVLVHHVLREDVAGAGAHDGLRRDVLTHDGLAQLELER